MKTQRVWLLRVSLVLVCGIVGCGEKPELEPKPVVEKPKAGIEDKPIVSEAQKEYGERLGLEVEITNRIGMKLKLIPAGEFMMGMQRFGLQHKVRITKPFYLGVYEVTQAEYEKVMEENPSSFKRATNPVEMVTWNDAVEFCEKLSAKEGKTYLLPTEAQWEYACRVGTTTMYSFGDDTSQLGEYAWFTGNSVKTHPVGEKKPNAWGLHDMHGKL